MSKQTLSTLLCTFIVAGWPLIGCDSDQKTEKEKLALEQKEAIEVAEQVYDNTVKAVDSTDVSESLAAADSLEAITKAKREYLYALQECQGKLNEHINELDQKLTDPNQANQPQWVAKRRDLIRERDKVRANMMELQKPMTDERWTTAEQEIKELLSAIDKQLNESS